MYCPTVSQALEALDGSFLYLKGVLACAQKTLRYFMIRQTVARGGDWMSLRARNKQDLILRHAFSAVLSYNVGTLGKLEILLDSHILNRSESDS